jgi:hypothetical protein
MAPRYDGVPIGADDLSHLRYPVRLSAVQHSRNDDYDSAKVNTAIQKAHGRRRLSTPATIVPATKTKPHLEAVR